MQIPRCNDLLASLPELDYERLEPHLELVSLTAGQIVFRPDEWITHVHFPTSAVVALSLDLADGHSVDTAMIGHDGVVGLGVFSHPQAAHKAHVRFGGFAYRLHTDVMRAEFRRGQGLMKAWLLATRALMVQMGQISACNRYHSVEQRLARWVLSYQDKTRTDSINITHQEAAEMLGVRREAITLTAGRFSQAGLMRFERGQLHVLDREGLEQASCECYRSLLEQAPFEIAAHKAGTRSCHVPGHAHRHAHGGLPVQAMRMSKALSVMATSV